MHTFAEKPKTSEHATAAKSGSRRPHLAQRHDVDSVLRLQGAVGNQAVLRLLAGRPTRRPLEAQGDEQPNVTEQAVQTVEQTPTDPATIQRQCAARAEEDAVEPVDTRMQSMARQRAEGQDEDRPVVQAPTVSSGRAFQRTATFTAGTVNQVNSLANVVLNGTAVEFTPPMSNVAIAMSTDDTRAAMVSPTVTVSEAASGRFDAVVDTVPGRFDETALARGPWRATVPRATVFTQVGAVVPAQCSHKRSVIIQPKLTVNTPGDVFEQEADRVAEQVLGMAEGRNAVTPLPGLATGAQRKCSCGGTCSGCQKNRPEGEDASAQMKSDGPSRGGGMEAPPIVHETLNSHGQPLDSATRAFMEPRFGHDFSSVRVHTGVRAAQSAEAMNARAFTTGRDLVFGRGEYAPRTREGQRLLAHELAHVVQQQSGGVSGQLVQRDLIPYGQITWNDFHATPPPIDPQHPQPTDSEGAGVRSIFDVLPTYSPVTDASPTKPAKKCGTGKNRSTEHEAAAKPDPDSFQHPNAQMDQDQSWARKLYKTGDGTDYCAEKVPKCEAAFATSKAGIFFNGTKITKREECRTRMVPNCMTNDAPKERTRLLNHEQYHFNITNVLANNAKADLKARGATLNVTAHGCGNDAARDVARDEYNKKVDDALRKPLKAWLDAKNKAQDDYDTETVHGSDQGKQSAWETKVKDGLKGYGPPAATPPGATPAPSPAPPAATKTPRGG